MVRSSLGCQGSTCDITKGDVHILILMFSFLLSAIHVPRYSYCCTCNPFEILTLRVGGNYSLNIDQIEN